MWQMGHPGEPRRRGDGRPLGHQHRLAAPEVYDPDGTSWLLQYFAVIFVAFTLIVGYLAYRVVKDREGAPDPVDALVLRKK